MGERNFNMPTHFQKGYEIGRGSYATVYRATLDGRPVAAKYLHDNLYYGCRDQSKFVAKFKEYRILQRIKHKNIVELVDFFIRYNSPPILVTELLDCDLSECIGKMQGNKIPFLETVSIMLDVAEGLVCLHHCNPVIVHLDLASKNVLLTQTRQAKIADLGLAKFFSPKKTMLTSPIPGTPVYVAPETYFPNAEKRVEYSVKIDVFSCGVMLMEVINGASPNPGQFVDSDDQRIPEKERRKGDICQMGDHRLKGLVLHCIEDDSGKRLSAEEVVDWLHEEKSIIERKNTIARRRKPNQPPALRIILLGEHNTGKTSIIERFQNNCFPDKVIPTMGYRLSCSKGITLFGKRFFLNIEDTGRLERYNSIPTSFLRDADGVLVVFDVTNSNSFIEGVPKILELLHRDNHTSMILVGNKVDVGDRCKVSPEQAEQFAENLGVHYFETSAKTGQNIQKVFNEIAKEIYNKLDLSDIEKYPLAGNSSVLLGHGQTETSKSWWDWFGSWC